MNCRRNIGRLVSLVWAIFLLNQSLLLSAENQGQATATSTTDSGPKQTAFSFPAGPTRAPRYAVINLGQTGYPLRLSDSGLVLFEPDGVENVAGYRWQAGKLETLMGAGFDSGDRVSDISNDGTVVGQVIIYADGTIFRRVTNAAVWRPGVTGQQLLAYNGPDFEPYFDGRAFRSAASFINGMGRVWGTMTISVAGGIAWRDCVSWGSVNDAPTRQGSFSVSPGEFGPIASGPRTIPLCANDSGLLATEKQDSDGNFVGYYIGDTEATFYPTDINFAGHAVGDNVVSFFGGVVWWDGLKAHYVDDGFGTPYALDANDNILAQNPEGPVLWQRVISTVPEAPTHQMRSLSQLLPLGYSLDYAADMNSSGAILGSGYNPDSGYGNYLLIPASLAVDADRDGQIKLASEDSSDATSSAAPFRFWINDDVDRHNRVDVLNDFGGYDMQDDLDPWPRQSQLDWKLDTVPSMRDLEDWARLWINVGGLQDDIVSGKLLIGLKWVGDFTNGNSPAIKLLRAKESDGGTRYLTETTEASAQASGVYSHAIVNGVGNDTLVKPTGNAYDFVIPAEAVGDLSTSNSTAHFLFEGCQRGKGQLTIVFLQNNNGTYTKIGDGPGVYLDLKSVKEMYERWTVGDGNGALPAAIADIETKRLPSGVLKGFRQTFPLAAQERNRYILYVHGWNMEPWEKDAFAETAYKRLYWQGYKGGFGTFQWPTTYGDAFDAILGNYDEGEYIAWRSAAPLAAKLADLSSSYSGNVYVLAHSMGNVVTGEALRLAAQGGNTNLVKTYVATQAAVPGEAWDPALAASARLYYDAGRGPDTPDVYRDWMLSDHGTAAASRVNFFNTADYALNIWQTNQTFKPDFYFPSVYYYANSNVDSTDDNDYFKNSIALDPFTAELVIKSHTGILPKRLSLGDPGSATVTDRYKIFAYAAEPRSLALGGTAATVFGFSSLNLGSNPSNSENPSSLWPTDTLSGNRYSAHPWHSAQFRFSNMDQTRYWRTLLGSDGFDLPSL